MNTFENFKLQCEINGVSYEKEVPPLKRTLDLLRDDLGFRGTKEGCGEGECGACSILIDGELILSCLAPVMQVHGKKITTVEGVALGRDLSILQRKLVELGGTQCGICTPGIVLACEAFLLSKKEPTSENIREALAGNLCRCTGYSKIIEAVQEAMQELKS